MIVSFARLTLRIAHARSLKEKRRVVRSIIDKVKSRFDVRISEVEGHDSWQWCDLGFAVVGNNRVVLEGVVTKVIDYIANNAEAELVADFRDSLYYGGEIYGAEESE